MKRKYPLIGVSILAVILLVLGSLSNVVGYQAVNSTAVNDSPLFKTRTQRATEQQQNILTAQYLGKGKGKLLYFPMRDNKTEVLKNFFDSIKKMDDATFQRFLIVPLPRNKLRGFPPREGNACRCFTINIPGNSSLT